MKKSNQKGVSTVSIMLFGLLTLVIVLANAIVFNVNEGKRASAIEKLKTGQEKAVSFCGKSHDSLSKDCQIVGVYKCDQNFILKSNCLTGEDVILNYKGDYSQTCYPEEEKTDSPCYYYWLNDAGRDCTATKNLCQ